MKYAITTAIMTFLVLAGLTSVVFAQSPSPAAAGAGQLSTVISKGNADIAQRIASLNADQTRLSGLKHLSDTDKATFASQIQTEISGLNGQQSKLDADTDVKTARADRAAIFTQFRIYMLFIPKTNILAAGDSMGDVADIMTTIAGKLQTRIQQLQSQGKDVTALTAALTDLQAKIADAKQQYANAESSISSLVPDNGNNTVMQSNQAALKSARGMIKTGAADLKAGRADIQTIWNGIKGSKTISTSPTPSATP
jgi:chromosome segregation ATPase